MLSMGDTDSSVSGQRSLPRERYVMPAILLISGNNDRAVIALAREFATHKHEFYVVASGNRDAIYRTQWADKVVFERRDNDLSDELLYEIKDVLINVTQKATIAPTSEFLNRFLLQSTVYNSCDFWLSTLPSESVYLHLSEKSSSPTFIQSSIGMSSPAVFLSNEWRVPCVLKPKTLMANGMVRYPKLCATQVALKDEMASLKKDDWFCQEFVVGQSFYLCAYIDRFGSWDGYWQENILQQPNGKSVVMARSSPNQRFDVAPLMRRLHELGFRGPFMMEFLEDSNGTQYFIEINPRFWGPLSLAGKVCPELVARYLSDLNGQNIGAGGIRYSSEIYAWMFGASVGDLKIYPAFEEYASGDISDFLSEHDVYNRDDTMQLHGVY